MTISNGQKSCPLGTENHGIVTNDFLSGQVYVNICQYDLADMKSSCAKTHLIGSYFFGQSHFDSALNSSPWFHHVGKDPRREVITTHPNIIQLEVVAFNPQALEYTEVYYSDIFPQALFHGVINQFSYIGGPTLYPCHLFNCPHQVGAKHLEVSINGEISKLVDS